MSHWDRASCVRTMVISVAEYIITVAQESIDVDGGRNEWLPLLVAWQMENYDTCVYMYQLSAAKKQTYIHSYHPYMQAYVKKYIYRYLHTYIHSIAYVHTYVHGYVNACNINIRDRLVLKRYFCMLDTFLKAVRGSIRQQNLR